MAVPSKWRIVIENLTGVDIAANGVNASFSGTIVGPTDNGINPQAEITLTNSAIIANNTFGNLTPDHDNATDKYDQVDGTIAITGGAGASGDANVYLNISASGVTKFSDSKVDALTWLKTVPFTAATTETHNIRF